VLEKRAYTIILLLGCLKGEQHSRYHLKSLATEIHSGLQVLHLIRRLVKVKNEAGTGQGLSFLDKFRAVLLLVSSRTDYKN
jgi:hypothetical protein